MTDRQTRNVSLPAGQDAFVDALVAGGRFRTASEVVREGLRLLEEVEHRRLLEKWLYAGLEPHEAGLLPAKIRDRAKVHFERLVADALADVDAGRLEDGPQAMERLKKRLEGGPD